MISRALSVRIVYTVEGVFTLCVLHLENLTPERSCNFTLVLLCISLIPGVKIPPGKKKLTRRNHYAGLEVQVGGARIGKVNVGVRVSGAGTHHERFSRHGRGSNVSE